MKSALHMLVTILSTVCQRGFNIVCPFGIGTLAPKKTFIGSSLLEILDVILLKLNFLPS